MSSIGTKTCVQLMLGFCMWPRGYLKATDGLLQLLIIYIGLRRAMSMSFHAIGHFVHHAHTLIVPMTKIIRVLHLRVPI
jgi:hypothetical protein